MQLALIGIPSSGVKTIYSALSGHAEAGEAVRPTSPGQTRLTVLKVPDQRLDLLAGIFKPKKVVPATVELAEFPGLFAAPRSDASRVAKAREADALALVLRSFESDVAPHQDGMVDPQRDLRNLLSELALSDLAVVEARLERLKRSVKRKDAEEELAEQDVLLRLKEALESGASVRDVELGAEDSKRIRGFGFLSAKPLLLIVNIGESQLGQEEPLLGPFTAQGWEAQALCGSLEAELSQLDESERIEFMQDFGVEELAAPTVLSAAYRVLETRTFLTYGEDECRAWNVRIGDTAVDAAGKIHSDLARGFIRAEVIAWEDFDQHRDLKKIKAAGKFRLEGKDYVVQEGDLIIIRHSG